ncbi:asparagine synthase-related protein [Geomonas edaphica]|uniref:asparagine synthase-related protein n=1 Tax=Geomonas edaphica TaxID=2570226 RepID=UPI0010A82C31|nr:asparagine synthase-related protein [Geomonas edaphica]
MNKLNLQELPNGDWMFTQLGTPPQKISKIDAMHEKTNGVFIYKKNAGIEIVTDNFGTIPVFYDSESESIANEIGLLTHNDEATAKPDLPGFWESIIYDYSFSSRTLNRGIIQIPSGSIFYLDFKSKQWTITRWYFFNINTYETNQSELLRSIDNRLAQICSNLWERLPPNGKILLPLSGGLDSRLLALHLASSGDVNRIKAVTFGFSKKTYEYRIARQVCSVLNITDHTFHDIPRNLYPEIAYDFWNLWRGCLSVTHAHLFSYLKRYSNNSNLLITGFMADAVAGYAASQRQEPIQPLENFNVFKKLKIHAQELNIDETIISEIILDLEYIYDDWKNNCFNIGFDEYVYLTQRQSKTFSLLIQTYKKYCEVVAPFSDPLLEKLFISAPFDLRRDKKIIRQLMNMRRPDLSNIEDLSSSISLQTTKQYIHSMRRKWSSRFAVLSSLCTNDKIRFFSPYWTEDLNGAFRRECRNDILSTLRYLFDNDVINYEQFKILAGKPVRSNEVSRCGKILSLLPASTNDVFP